MDRNWQGEGKLATQEGESYPSLGEVSVAEPRKWIYVVENGYGLQQRPRWAFLERYHLVTFLQQMKCGATFLHLATQYLKIREPLEKYQVS